MLERLYVKTSTPKDIKTTTMEERKIYLLVLILEITF